jgi:hypothetical protein
MDLQSQVIEAIRAELNRQAGEAGSDLTIKESGSCADIIGNVDLEALAMAISGAVAGGP